MDKDKAVAIARLIELLPKFKASFLDQLAIELDKRVADRELATMPVLRIVGKFKPGKPA